MTIVIKIINIFSHKFTLDKMNVYKKNGQKLKKKFIPKLNLDNFLKIINYKKNIWQIYDY